MNLKWLKPVYYIFVISFREDKRKVAGVSLSDKYTANSTTLKLHIALWPEVIQMTDISPDAVALECAALDGYCAGGPRSKLDLEWETADRQR